MISLALALMHHFSQGPKLRLQVCAKLVQVFSEEPGEMGTSRGRWALLDPKHAHQWARWKQTNVDRRFLRNLFKEHLLLQGCIYLLVQMS